MKTGLYSNDIVLELDNIRELTKRLNNPQAGLKLIHVAGTNGKGSVCAFLENTLKLSGFTCGKFTSPEIKSVCDSISVNGENISVARLEELTKIVKESYSSASDFEYLVCCAFLYFKEKKCDFVILETGLGGTGDATNIIASPLYSIITKISLEHMNFLGDTLEKIAEKKAGIIKKNSKTVTLKNQADEVLKVIEKKCEKENNTLILTKEPIILTPNGTSERFIYENFEFESGLFGIHQIENALLAIEVLKDLKIPDDIIARGIKTAKNPARFEKISENPDIFFDGAHNPDGLFSLLSSLARYFPNQKKIFIIGMMRDKDIKGVTDLFKEFNEDKLSEILTVEVLGNPRSENPESLKNEFLKRGFDAKNAKNLSSALKLIKKDRITVICGSLYLYREL